ncbi:AcrR family transcriptional regulator [Kribbella voronezhensis]|uniref:AcrR family transcriptional regulator n=1 Tax=Kribbella voronezhensis TaxID=2512212 RepID=A0A4R7TFW9_9ACTN|nr:TetR/AcrR family transcriptional regulator [Kribbella voronezhensis]TDU91141.1 AcrR family transcriptional regulator [Kribbella voronezhensis]
MTVTVDETLREATVAVLAKHGWDGVTLERVAEQVGRSRVTLWRQGLTVEALLNSLLDALASDYRDAMWPVLTATGTGRQGLVNTLNALFEVQDRHLPLMMSSDLIFHREQERNGSVIYLEPFERFLREGAEDGSLHPRGRIDDVAEIVMVSAAMTYVHMRGRHHWSKSRARRLTLDLILRGLVEP